MDTILTHKFTDAGLGQAPFRFTGVSENVFKFPDGGTKPGGCCDYCFTGIRYEFHIVSADGKKSKVGCDCIKRVNDHKLMKVADIAKKKLIKEKKLETQRKNREAELERQRQINGGLTDYELRFQQEQEEKKRLINEGLQKGLKWANEVARLEDGKNGFRDSVAEDMRFGRLPMGKGLSITIDILAKQMGRRDSKAYEAEYERLEDLFSR